MHKTSAGHKTWPAASADGILGYEIREKIQRFFQRQVLYDSLAGESARVAL
jgi:hypothetical protein